MTRKPRPEDADAEPAENIKAVNVPKELVKKVSRSIAAHANSSHGNSIERSNPALALLAIQELARGLTATKIEKKHNIDRCTISRLLHRHREVIDDIREYIAADSFLDLQVARGIMHKKFEQMDSDPEAIAKANLRDVVQSVALLGEGYRSSVGENKVIVEHRSGPGIEDFAKHLEDLKAKARAKLNGDGAIDVTPKC